MALSIGETLKKYRNMNKISVKEISDLLCSHGYKASESTIYSWENDNSQPTPGAFLLMCKAYNIDNNILEIFGYGSINKKSDLLLNIDEINHIKKYRNLDNHGKEAVNSILEVEHKRHIKNTIQQPKPIPTPAPKVIEFDPEEVETITLKHSEYKASAGTGYILFDDCLEEDLKVVFNNLTRKADICIDVFGNSMEPKYYDGDILLVRKQPDVEIGEIGIFIIDDKGFVKKKGTEGLISINKDYDIIPKSEDIKCFGKVLGVLEKDWIR